MSAGEFFFVPEVADPSAPTAAELDAGVPLGHGDASPAPVYEFDTFQAHCDHEWVTARITGAMSDGVTLVSDEELTVCRLCHGFADDNPTSITMRPQEDR